MTGLLIYVFIGACIGVHNLYKCFRYDVENGVESTIFELLALMFIVMVLCTVFWPAVLVKDCNER